MSESLSTMDDILFVAAAGILAFWLVRWLMRSRQNPLASVPERPNTVREDAVAMAVFAYLVGTAVVAAVVAVATVDADKGIGVIARMNGGQVAGIAGCVYVGLTRFGGGLRSFAVGRGAGGDPILVVGVTLLAVAFCPVIRDASAACLTYLAPGFETQPHPTISALHDATQSVAVRAALWAGAGAVAPVAEELFFRGILQTFLVSLLRSRSAAILVAAILFGAVHFHQPSAVPALVVFGILLGFVYERTGALVWPIVIHAAFNLKTLIWDALGSPVG